MKEDPNLSSVNLTVINDPNVFAKQCLVKSVWVCRISNFCENWSFDWVEVGLAQQSVC